MASISEEPAKFAEKEYRNRLELPSTFKTNIILEGSHSVFAVLFRESIMLISDILHRESHVDGIWQQLPGVARKAYLSDLLTEELLSTNLMEGVQSTRQEVSAALQSVDKPSSHTRFSEFAKLYTGLNSKDALQLPESLVDIRDIYDKVVQGELDEGTEPDGELFRKDQVYIHDISTGREIHRGLPSEISIQTALTQMLIFMHKENIPSLVKAIICHYAFEYIHPFYDGNGRTGRFLLALQLREHLSAPTALSLSPVIAGNKQIYYKAFENAENPLNCSELSFFVYQMLQFIQIAQKQLEDSLQEKDYALGNASRAAAEFAEQNHLDKTSDAILSMLIQQRLFHEQSPELTRTVFARYEGVGQVKIRTKLQSLIEKGLVSTVGKRPIYYELSDKACELFGIV